MSESFRQLPGLFLPAAEDQAAGAGTAVAVIIQFFKEVADPLFRAQPAEVAEVIRSLAVNFIVADTDIVEGREHFAFQGIGQADLVG